MNFESLMIIRQLSVWRSDMSSFQLQYQSLLLVTPLTSLL